MDLSCKQRASVAKHAWRFECVYMAATRTRQMFAISVKRIRPRYSALIGAVSSDTNKSARCSACLMHESSMTIFLTGVCPALCLPWRCRTYTSFSRHTPKETFTIFHYRLVFQRSCYPVTIDHSGTDPRCSSVPPVIMYMFNTHACVSHRNATATQCQSLCS